jgi:hypothetical protein
MAIDLDKKILLAQNLIKRLTALLKQAEDSGEEDDYNNWDDQLTKAINKLGRLTDDKKALK